MNDDRSLWEISPDVAWVDDDERVVLLALSPIDPTGPRVLIGSAAAIWRACATQISTNDLIDALASGFDSNPSDISDDTQRFLTELLGKDLVRRIG